MMKNVLLLSFVTCSLFVFSQETCDTIKEENNSLKTKNQIIQNENYSLKEENDYLKKVLNINTPIFQQEKDNTLFKITKIVGNKADNIIYITLLFEAKNENKALTIEPFNTSIIDLEGNEYKLDHYKSNRLFPKLALGVPKKVVLAFKEVESQPLIIKLFRIKTSAMVDRDSNPFNKTKANVEFRDLKVNWN